MLTISGKRHGGYCDGATRRSFMKIGAMGIAGLALPDLFRMESLARAADAAGAAAAAPPVGTRPKGIINIYLAGGPPQTDMFDLKPGAPSEYRGEFNAIKTNVAGMEVSELMPRLAKVADKFSVVRSIVGSVDKHSSIHTQTGWDEDELKAVGGHPSLGAVVSKLQGSHGGAPPFVSMMGMVTPGFIGPAHGPFSPEGQGRENLTLRRIKADRLQSRTELLASLDGLKRDVDSSGAMEAMDSFTQRAVEVVTSGRVADALDLEKEKPEVRERYTGGAGDMRDAAQNILMARRLIEAGVRAVSLTFGGWDTHSDNFNQLRRQLPPLDAALAALLLDLDERGMSNDVTVVMWGEFGRTPRVNSGAGRDHWPRVMQAFIAGGGMKNGQVVGATDRYGGEAADRPVHLREMFATLYHNMGIDAKATTITDPAGRPQYLVDGYDPIKELVA
ncbi:MAG: hypothetical protein AVDCRST_MAG64-1817 [uncultured Phycisphaerae bacterium]|uniref:DUF1501 domain-containing protein n=1 Tax=uncultured Phycisphaerae bacterium TaxID=904963 RepID=A0A6J4P0N8_9BACT|nr:MAG: hypothetical protein AVDCRST_MAG64-1817 [uncultured Phycisphaerae bacterium]